MLFSLHKHYLEIYITDTALKVSRFLSCLTTSISHGVENYFSWLWGTGISAIFLKLQDIHTCNCRKIQVSENSNQLPVLDGVWWVGINFVHIAKGQVI